MASQTPVGILNAVRYSDPIEFGNGQSCTVDYDAAHGRIYLLTIGADGEQSEANPDDEKAIALATAILYTVARGRAERMPVQQPLSLTEGGIR